MNVDVSKAMHDGRRLRWSRRAATSGVALAVVAISVAASGAFARAADVEPAVKRPASCTVAALPLGGLKGVELDGADPTGRWQFGTVNPNVPHPRMASIIWHDEKVVAEIPVKSEIALKAINSSGVAVGWDNRRPFVVRDGVRSAMKGIEKPVSINSSGAVAGFEDSSWEDRRYPVRWSSADAEPQRLPDIDGIKADTVSLITDDGLVVGMAGDGANLLWFADGRTRLIRLPDPEGKRIAAGPAISYRDGWLYFSRARYQVATGKWENTAGSTPESGMTDEPRAWLGTASFALPKPEYWNDKLGFVVTSVSDDGHYVGGETLSTMADMSIPVTPLRWTCTGGAR